MIIRLAAEQDINQLIKMRWDFTNEFNEHQVPDEEYDAFFEECRTFLTQAIQSEKWCIWVAEINAEIVSHVYIELIDKVPRPGRTTNPFAYMTNVYTLPEHRGHGVGSELLQTIERWSSEQRHEFILVWPSDWSVKFYEGNGFKHCTEPMERIIK